MKSLTVLCENANYSCGDVRGHFNDHYKFVNWWWAMRFTIETMKFQWSKPLLKLLITKLVYFCHNGWWVALFVGFRDWYIDSEQYFVIFHCPLFQVSGIRFPQLPAAYLGPQQAYTRLGMTTISNKDPLIHCTTGAIDVSTGLLYSNMNFRICKLTVLRGRVFEINYELLPNN